VRGKAIWNDLSKALSNNETSCRDLLLDTNAWIAHLASQGTPIGANDMMIASIALEHGLTLVTNNTSEFSRVSGLKLEDWQ